MMKRIRKFLLKLFKTQVEPIHIGKIVPIKKIELPPEMREECKFINDEPIKQTDPELLFLEKYVKIAKHHGINHMMISLEDYNKLKELCLKNNGKNPDFKIIPEFELVPNKIIPERYEYKGIGFNFSITLDVY